MASGPTKRIALDRRVCVVKPGSVTIRPTRSAILLPAVGLLASVGVFAVIARFGDTLSVGLLAGLLVPSLLVFPLAGMGLFYSLFGSRVVIEASKQSASFQQGPLGLGLGIMELVPFWKVDRIIVEEVEMGEAEMKGLKPALDFRSFAVVLLKASGKRLTIGEVVTPDEDDLLQEAFGRAQDVAESVADIMQKPVEVTVETVEEEEEHDATSDPKEAIEQPQITTAHGMMGEASAEVAELVDAADSKSVEG